MWPWSESLSHLIKTWLAKSKWNSFKRGWSLSANDEKKFLKTKKVVSAPFGRGGVDGVLYHNPLVLTDGARWLGHYSQHADNIYQSESHFSSHFFFSPVKMFTVLNKKQKKFRLFRLFSSTVTFFSFSFKFYSHFSPDTVKSKIKILNGYCQGTIWKYFLTFNLFMFYPRQKKRGENSNGFLFQQKGFLFIQTTILNCDA